MPSPKIPAVLSIVTVLIAAGLLLYWNMANPLPAEVNSGVAVIALVFVMIMRGGFLFIVLSRTVAVLALIWSVYFLVALVLYLRNRKKGEQDE